MGSRGCREDSEEPWKCTIVLSRLRSAAGVHADSGNYSEPVVRVRVPTFSQTARRSKVDVALLKVPFPLPDVAVGQFRVSMRDITCQCLFLPWPPSCQDLTRSHHSHHYLTASPGCRYGGPPCPNLGCTSNPRVRYPSSPLPQATCAWRPFASRHLEEDTLLNPNQASDPLLPQRRIHQSRGSFSYWVAEDRVM